MNLELISSFIGDPKGSLLILVAILNLFWVFYVVFIKRNYTSQIYKAYFFYAFFVLLWVISNAYFQTELLLKFDKAGAKFMALIANVSCYLSIIGFYYISCLLKDKVSKRSWYLIVFFVIATLLLNLIPNLTVQDVIIFEDGHFELIFSNLNIIFFLMGLIVTGISFYNFISAVKNSKAKLENMRVFYIMFAISLMYFSAIIFTIIYPTLLHNYQYVWLPPVLSILDVLIVGYAILTKRFMDIRLLISRILKFTVASSVSIMTTYVLLQIVILFSQNTLPQIFINIFLAVSIILVYVKAMGFLTSHTFYRFFGSTNSEHFIQVVKELQNKAKVYTSLKQFEHEIQKKFCTKRNQILPKIIPLNVKIKKQYPNLIKFFRKNRGILVTEEVKFTESQQEELIPFLEELESLGGICLPLFHPSKGLVGFFTLGEKSYNHLYTREEITALENMSSYLNFVITGILYNSELQEEVEIKTLQLKQKAVQLKEKIKRIRELLDQQSDFIAVTAHEFRTPLSIALFQMEDLLEDYKKTPKLSDDIGVIKNSLENLKNLVQKMFSVQQFDLNKVELKKEPVEIKQFVKDVYKDFNHIMKQKSINFTFEDNIKTKTKVNLDQEQTRQVFHNILNNAYKFTEESGKIKLSLESDKGHVIVKIGDNGKGVPDDYKKKVFEKFRTNHAAKGIGLGLYICKKIIELHEGKLWIEDSELGGAAFCISLNKG